MRRSFIFDVRTNANELGESHFTVVHIGPAELTETELRADLVDYFDTHEHLPPDRIVLLGTESSSESLRALADSEVIKSSIPEFTRNSNPPPISCLRLGSSGSVCTTESLATRQVFSEILRQGLFSLFRQREAMLTGGDFVHYAKPSEKHCEKFIRAANVLVRSTDVEFLGFCLLPYLIRFRPRYIYTDTATISAVAYSAVVQMRLLDQSYRVPMVDSFSSHAGVRNYEFEHKDESLFLISASTSGDLERIITHEVGILASHVVTLFYVGERRPKSQILCDVSKRSDNPLGWINVVKSYPAEECPLCERGLRLIRIVGDQFLTSDFEVVPRLITVGSKPDWLESFAGDLVGLGVFTSHKLADSSEERPRELFVDLAKLYRMAPQTMTGTRGGGSGVRLLRELDRVLMQVVPVRVSEIIYLRNESSKALALRIRRLLKGHTTAKVRMVPASRVLQLGRTPRMAEGTAIVVAGAVVAGQQLMEVSQALRFQKKSVSYFAGLLRTRDAARKKEICANLRQGGETFNYLTDIYLPDDPSSRPSPWDREVKTLKELRKRIAIETSGRKVLDARITALESAKAREGLRENLFWPAIDGKSLVLRPNFAFWKFDYSARQNSQADVYFTICAVLHAWRAEHSEDTASGHTRLLLSPRNFVRFNDGVIQASLLRAALSGEMDYRARAQYSELMSNVLEIVFRNSENDRGEGCVEFLLAILERRMRLVTKDVYKLVEKLQPKLSRSVGRYPVAAFASHLCAAILDLLDKE